MAKKGKRKFRLIGLLYVLLILFICGFFICGGIGVFYISSILKDVPELDVSQFTSSESSRIYDQNGELIVDLGEHSRENVEFDELPQVVIDAFIAVEDSRFFEHNGFDLPRFVRAFIENIKTRDFSQGGSTITMQIVKNSYFTNEKSIPRKIKEIYLALKAEKILSKKEIFEFYINKILFGGNNYGIQKGSEYYFGKNASELTLSEAAFLAGVVNAPGSYNPYVNLELSENRRNVVLNLMYHHGYITLEECTLAKSIPLENQLVFTSSDKTEYPYQAYLDAVVEECISLTGDDPYSVPMIIYTYMDRDAQSYAEDILAGKTNVTYPKDDPYFQAAFSVIENTTGHIIALGGGRNYIGQRQFNRATRMKKQPGSTAKPLLAYSLAFEELGWATTHTVKDVPIVYRGTNILLPNADGQYLGEISLEDAIARSRNTSAMLTFEQLVDTLDVDYIINHIQNLGFDVDKNQFSLGYVIGSSSFEVSPTQLAAAYSVFARGGEYIRPTTIQRIEYIENTNESVEPQYLPTRVLSEQASYLTSVMLNKDTTSPYFNYMQILQNKNFKVYAKTGTTDYGVEAEAYGIPAGVIKDKWTAGFTGDYTVAVWTGYDEPVKGAETYFTAEKNKLNIPVTILKDMLFNLASSTDKYPADIPRPEGISEITHVKGTYPYAYSSEVDEVMITTGLIKDEFNEVVNMSPSPVDTLTNFEAGFMEETGSLVVTFDEYPDSNRVQEATGTKKYSLIYYPDKDQVVPSKFVVPINPTQYDEEGNEIQSEPLVDSEGNAAVKLEVEASLIYDEKLYFGNVNYFVDIYENNELLTTYNSQDASTAYILPQTSTNTIKACGYYGLTIARDVRSNEICHEIIVPFSSQLPTIDDIINRPQDVIEDIVNKPQDVIEDIFDIFN